MQALAYENLLRRIYQVGRRGKPEADADVYRKLEYSERAYFLDVENIRQKRIRISTKPIEDLEYDYRVECRRIWRIVTEALRTGINKYRDQLSNADLEKLEQQLREPERITKEAIDQTIKIAEDIFTSHKIFAP